jgi:hypothetical protein
MLILAFFMTMATLQYARNFGGRLDEAPALKPSLELAAEDGATEWDLYANGKKLGHAVSQVLKTQAGLYTLRQAVILDGDIEGYLGPLSLAAKGFGVQLNEYTATLRTQMDLTYLGTMKNMEVAFAALPRPKIVLPEKEPAKPSPEEELSPTVEKKNVIALRISGRAQNDTLVFKGHLEMAGNKFPIDEHKVKHKHRDTYLSNIAPTDCLAGLRPGQRWQTAVIDPTAIMFSAFTSSKSKEITSGQFDPDEILQKKVTEVVVLEEPKVLEWHGTKVMCYVVQTGERGSKMQVWVRAADSRVMRQLIEWQNKSVELVRKPKKDDD